MFGEKIWVDMVCIEAHTEFSPATVAGVLDTIRNRVLNFALEIGKEAPEAGEVSAADLPVSQQRIEQLFQTFVIGSVGAFSTSGDASIGSIEVSVPAGDISSLRSALAQLGLPQRGHRRAGCRPRLRWHEHTR